MDLPISLRRVNHHARRFAPHTSFPGSRVCSMCVLCISPSNLKTFDQGYRLHVVRLAFECRGLLDPFPLCQDAFHLAQTGPGQVRGSPRQSQPALEKCCLLRWIQWMSRRAVVYFPCLRIRPLVIVFQSPMLDRSRKELERL